MTVKLIAYLNALFAQTKVSEHNVSFVVKQNVLWLEIAIHNVILVHVRHSRDHLRTSDCSEIYMEPPPK